MIPGTHLIICSIIYKYILKKTRFVLDYKSFAYGNIRPDIEKWSIPCEHTFKGSISTIDAYAESIINSSISFEEFSMGLGVICHFVSDYFCLYHQEAYWKRDSVSHGLYEIKLHTKLLDLVFNDKLRVNYTSKEEGSVSELVIKFKNKYDREPEGIMKDIGYSIAAAAAVSKMIVTRKKENEKYPLEMK